mgnify:FL=1|jgi:hypothetical protein|tara:strand:+ start:2510 stop:2623 length:114 start_codon:yes stop_codon:yes gene_type:complete
MKIKIEVEVDTAQQQDQNLIDELIELLDSLRDRFQEE